MSVSWHHPEIEQQSLLIEWRLLQIYGRCLQFLWRHSEHEQWRLESQLAAHSSHSSSAVLSKGGAGSLMNHTADWHLDISNRANMGFCRGSLTKTARACVNNLALLNSCGNRSMGKRGMVASGVGVQVLYTAMNPTTGMATVYLIY